MSRKLIAGIMLGCTLAMSVNAATMTIETKDGVKKQYLLSDVKNIAFGANVAVLKAPRVVLNQELNVVSRANRLLIKMSGKAQAPYSVMVYDLGGRSLFSRNARLSASGKNILELPNIAAKVCLVRFSTNGTSISKLIHSVN
jgi:hypothetical protein